MPEINDIFPQLSQENTVTVSARDSFNYFNLDNFKNQNLLKSCKFAIRVERHPNILSYYSREYLRQFTLLCDSIEFPGRSITTTDFNIPGRQKVRTPYKREFNEVTLTFYHNTKFSVYQYFTDWLDQISPNSTTNSYFDDIVNELTLFQFYDTTANYSTGFGGGGGAHVKYPQMEVKIYNAYPVSIASLPSNWADDGFHKITATFFYEYTGLTTIFGQEGKNFRRRLRNLPLSTIFGGSLDDYLRGEAAGALDVRAKQDFLDSLQPPKINFGD